MADFLSSALGVGAAVGGYMLGGIPGAIAGATLGGSFMTNQTNIDLASEQRDFSAQQASTTYSRGAADMARAGLNPILAYANPAQVASYQQPQIQNSLALGASAFNDARATDAKMTKDYSSANRDLTEAGATEARLPHEVSNLKTVNQKLLSEIENISFQNKFIDANTAKSVAETGLTHAQTNVASAQASNIRQDTLKKVEETALAKLNQALADSTISKQRVEQIVLYADAALKSEQAKTALSQQQLNDAQKALAEVRQTLAEPSTTFNKNHPYWSQFLEGSSRLFKSVPGLSLLIKAGD